MISRVGELPTGCVVRRVRKSERRGGEDDEGIGVGQASLCQVPDHSTSRGGPGDLRESQAQAAPRMRGSNGPYRGCRLAA